MMLTLIGANMRFFLGAHKLHPGPEKNAMLIAFRPSMTFSHHGRWHDSPHQHQQPRIQTTLLPIYVNDYNSNP